jgi:hypothetical protein
MDERKAKELKLVENHITLELNKEKQGRKDSEQKISKFVDEKAFALRIEIAREKKAREENEDKYAKELADHLAKLQEDLDIEQKIRY